MDLGAQIEKFLAPLTIVHHSGSTKTADETLHPTQLLSQLVIIRHNVHLGRALLAHPVPASQLRGRGAEDGVAQLRKQATIRRPKSLDLDPFSRR